MRTSFVQFNFEGVELSYECSYRTEATGEIYDVEATLAMVGPDQNPPTRKERVKYRFAGPVWHQFLAALDQADAEKYPPVDRDDVVNFGKDRY